MNYLFDSNLIEQICLSVKEVAKSIVDRKVFFPPLDLNLNLYLNLDLNLDLDLDLDLNLDLREAII